MPESADTFYLKSTLNVVLFWTDMSAVNRTLAGPHNNNGNLNVCMSTSCFILYIYGGPVIAVFTETSRSVVYCRTVV